MASNVHTDMEEEALIEINLPLSTHKNNMTMNEESTIASVIIEELDENALSNMNVDMTEFVEANALEMKDITQDIMPEAYSEESSTVMDITTDIEDQDILLTADEEDKLTRQFLNGELTFSEYSLRMDQGADTETVETDLTRNDNVNEEIETNVSIYRKAPKRYKRKKRTLPPVLQGLMGEANLRFARGDTELAAQICMEIIRQVPSAPEPFHTLAMIYEADQPEKSLQFALIAAHLSPRDSDQWVRLANMSLESGNIKQAITCYNKAIQANPKDIDLYETRAQLLEQNGDKKAYLRGFSKLVHQLEPEDGNNIVKYAKMLAKRYMEENNNEQALEAMENIFTKCPTFITLEEVNIMTEILIALKRFKRCLHILTKYTSIWVKYKNITDKQNPHATVKKSENEKKEELEDRDIGEIEACGIPDDVVVDLKAKFLIILIELDQMELAENLLPKFYLNENPEISGDLFLDIAETLMGKKKFECALALLDPLVNSNNYSLAAVWLRHAECWVGCKDLKKAIESYEIVTKLSSQHLGARIALAKLYQLKGQYNKAIEILDQDPDSDTLDPRVIYRRTLLLYKVKRYDEYFRSGMLLFSRHCVYLRSKVELNTLTRAYGTRQRIESLKLHRLSRGEKFEEENVPIFLNTTELSEKNEYFLLVQMCKVACKLKKYGLLQRICLSALTSKRFEKRNIQIMFLSLVSCIYNNDSYHGYNIVRQLIRICHRPNTWNLLNIIIQNAQDCRHNRFIMRLLGREDVFSHLNIMHANNCLVSGTYKYALNDYISLFKVAPSALLALLIGVTLLQMACQKLSAKKNQLVIQAIAFLKKYCQLRGEDAKQEAYYNMGRAFHQIRLLSAAIHFYKLALNEDPGDLVKKNSYFLNLKQEAAFNLHLIYLESENYLLAKMYLEKYIVI
ncbi:general transcription factor 3C polypeptide 3 isoform X1 [Hylaeus volcanicus]|uniref:general transcription factor 3C polypeptide 3 isoform X1 n=1 Tax=Hylaeus volcanicus TaxID=313075 RepID=UPI0023B79A76|nr:general transcription factor 3C polypeptide 3 isoform X1 [Hylaeus volcanicus]